jgi:hypothetical protein
MIKMRVFTKKVTIEEFLELSNTVQDKFNELEQMSQYLEKELSIMSKLTLALCPLPKQFNGLQNQFTEFVNEFNKGPANSSQRVRDPVRQSDSEKEFLNLTPLEQKGLIILGKLQNESGAHMIRVGDFTSNLYPDRINGHIKTTVSNILKKLSENGLVSRERQGNHWFVGLSSQGFQLIKKLVHDNQLKTLNSLYEKSESKKVIPRAH